MAPRRSIISITVIWQDAVAGEVAVGLNAVILSDNVGHVISFEREHFEAIIAAYSEFTKREAER